MEESTSKKRNELTHNYFGSVDDDSNYPIKNLIWDKFKKIPNCIGFEYMFDREIINAFIEKYKDNIVTTSEYYYDKKEIVDKYYHIILFCFNEPNNVVYVKAVEDYCDGRIAIKLYFSIKTKSLENLVNEINNYKIDQNNNKYINLLVSSLNGFSLLQKEIQPPTIDFSLNYNEDFEEVNELIVNKLSKDNSKGLVLLYGEPGTGKTTYIRHLINKLNKNVIYLPPNMTDSISSPHLIKFLVDVSNSILVIEDAENILMKRSGYSSQAISNLLNLTDGLLSDCLNIQIVATFNTSILNIDKALLRKGRLIAQYEFKKLSNDRARKLAEKLKVEVVDSFTLADIYNTSEMSFDNGKKKIGF
jgi:broad-specificity NMP kinase